MNIAVVGGAGFIGINLALHLSKEPNNNILIIDGKEEYLQVYKNVDFLYSNVSFIVAPFDIHTVFDEQVAGQDVVYHLASTNIPGTSNSRIAEELESNVVTTAKLLDACVKQKVKKIVFISSGGAVYGDKAVCPIKEDALTYPITSYGIQKIAIEKLLYLYRYQHGLDYRIIRLANPYGPYQRPNGRVGVITTFVYRAITKGVVEVYGDGTVVRDFIYIDDAIRGILNIVNLESEIRVFNLGSGKGTSVNEVIDILRKHISPNLQVQYYSSRPVDVQMNYLDISRYEKCFGKLRLVSLDKGIQKTTEFLLANMIID